MRLIWKNDMITGQPGRPVTLPVSKGSLGVIISKGFYINFLLALAMFCQEKIHQLEQVGDWGPY